MQRKGVDTASQFIRQQMIQTPMALERQLAGKHIGNNHHPKVRLGTRWHVVITALVDYLEMRWGQGLLNLVANLCLRGHPFINLPLG